MSRILSGRRVLLTGHTGFKGGWLALWLRRLGADLSAVALPPADGVPSFFRAVGVEDVVDRHRLADITDEAALAAAVAGVDAELVIHMAAQALVRPSYEKPVETFRTNVVGTAMVLEAARRMPSLRGVIVVTSDKCYENVDWDWGYRENDRLGGSDPYSASKGCAELVVTSWRRSFFAEPDAPLLASVRAGNVFGGGDWSVDRLVPDIIRAVRAGEPALIRNPRSIRPWQHVLEPLSGYLELAVGLLEGRRELADAWNFGPDNESVVDVETLARSFRRAWGSGLHFEFGSIGPAVHEARTLRLDSSRAKMALGWRPRLTLDAAVDLTVEWYRALLGGERDMRALSERQIERYTAGIEPAPASEKVIPISRAGEATICA